MKTEQIYHSPIICYEVTEDKNTYGINVYFSTHKGSENRELNCEISNITTLGEKAHAFAKELARNCALPLHVPELLEEFLSL